MAKLQKSSYDLRDRVNLIPLVGSNPTSYTNFSVLRPMDRMLCSDRSDRGSIPWDRPNNMKQKYIDLYMGWAERTADLSHAQRLKVGAVIVKDDTVIFGYNGMPAGWDNNCEINMYDDAEQWVGNRTRPEVLHAESNALAKLAKSTNSGLDATLFVTHSPCLDCAKLIYQSGISHVYYRNSYRDRAGLEFLEKSGVEILHVNKV